MCLPSGGNYFLIITDYLQNNISKMLHLIFVFRMGDPNAFFEKLHINRNGTILIVPLTVHEKQKYFEEYYYGKLIK